MKRRLKKKKMLNGKQRQFALLSVLYAVFLLMAGLFAVAGNVVVAESESISFPSADSKSEFQLVLEDIVSEYPIKSMVPHIARQDPLTATFLIAIAKQESNWGKYAPKNEDGRECWNFWGYRGQTEEVTPSGYSCFRSPREAVRIVGARLNTLVWEYERDTPKELLVWKCGSSCAGHDPADVAVWKRTVGMYAKKVEDATDIR